MPFPFDTEQELIDVLDEYDAVLERFVDGTLSFQEFLSSYDNFYWKYALDGHESDDCRRAILERQQSRIQTHQRISEDVLARVCDEADAANPEYIAAGRIGEVKALELIRKVVGDA